MEHISRNGFQHTYVLWFVICLEMMAGSNEAKPTELEDNLEIVSFNNNDEKRIPIMQSGAKSDEDVDFHTYSKELQEIQKKRSSQSTEKRISSAFDHIHFGSLLKKLSPKNNRASSSNKKQFAWHDDDGLFKNNPEKKALSFFSRFYPVFQPGRIGNVGDGGSESDLNISSQRRISFPQSGESFPMGRYSSRPIMRLRWGK